MHMNDAPELTQPTRPTQAGRPGGVWALDDAGAARRRDDRRARGGPHRRDEGRGHRAVRDLAGARRADDRHRPVRRRARGEPDPASGRGPRRRAVAAIVVTPFGGFNPRNLVAAAVVAIAVELAALVSRYRMLTWYGVLLAALLNGAFLLSIHWLVWRMSQMVPALQIGTAVSLVGAQIVWAALGVVVARMLARAGVHVSTSR
jgi:hypothetical protein